MFGRVKFVVTSVLMLGVLCALGCGQGSTSSTAPQGHSGTIQGHGGGMHALGANPEGEAARLKKGAGSSKRAQPGRLPGR